MNWEVDMPWKTCNDAIYVLGTGWWRELLLACDILDWLLLLPCIGLDSILKDNIGTLVVHCCRRRVFPVSLVSKM